MNVPASNAPSDYMCPICLGVRRIETDDTLMHPSDIVFQDDLVTVFVNSFFMGKNPGHVILVPNIHFENIYSLPTKYSHRIIELAQQLSLAIKAAYQADGITLRQNNEPAGDQHAFHYHMHVFPRYNADDFNAVLPEQKRLADPAERAEYSQKLQAALAELSLK